MTHAEPLERRPQRWLVPSRKTSGSAKLTTWAVNELRDNVIQAEFRDQFVAELRLLARRRP